MVYASCGGACGGMVETDCHGWMWQGSRRTEPRLLSREALSVSRRVSQRVVTDRGLRQRRRDPEQRSKQQHRRLDAVVRGAERTRRLGADKLRTSSSCSSPQHTTHQPMQPMHDNEWGNTDTVGRVRYAEGFGPSSPLSSASSLSHASAFLRVLSLAASRFRVVRSMRWTGVSASGASWCGGGEGAGGVLVGLL